MLARFAIVFTLALLSMSWGSADAAASPLERHGCGDPILHSFRLDNDLLCDVNALIVTKGGVTVDLNGHLISHLDPASANIVGVEVALGKRNVTVKNGVIRGFRKGVTTRNASGATLTGLTIIGAGTGIDVQNVPGSKITGNRVTSNYAGDGATTFGDGIIVTNDGTDTDGTIIDGNVVTGNQRDGIRVVAADDVAVTHNTVNLNSNDGIHIENTLRSLVEANTTTGNGRDGIHLGDINNKKDVVRNNRTTANGRDGIVVAGGSTVKNRIEGNKALTNSRHGINIGGGTGNAVVANKAHHNAMDGIRIQTSAVTVTDNQANYNGADDSEDTLDSDGFGINGGALNVASGNLTKGNLGGGCNPTHLCTNDPAATFPTDEVVEACGAHITASIKLGNNLACAGPAFIVADNPNITIDLNGHHITKTGPGVNTGIDNTIGSSNFLATNGVMRNWLTGIETHGGTGITVSDMLIQAAGKGIVMSNAQGATAINNVISGGPGATSAIEITGTAGAFADGNDISGVTTGIDLTNVDQLGNVNDNKLTYTGIGVKVSDGGGEVARNTALGGGKGFLVNGVTSSITFTSNVARANITGFELDVFAGNVATFKRNIAETNRLHGFDLGGTGTLTVKRNTASHNGGHGFLSDNSAETFIENIARRNGFFDNGVADGSGRGFEAPGGALGTGNISSGNDDASVPCNPPSLCS